MKNTSIPSQPTDAGNAPPPANNQDLLRIVLCGAEGDGKSALVEGLLRNARTAEIPTARRAATKRQGVQNRAHEPVAAANHPTGEHGLSATAEVTHHQLATPARLFFITDAPGDTRFLREMVASATTAQVAIVLVDAQRGLLDVTRRQAYLALRLGAAQIVLAVNKMDSVAFDASCFDRITAEFAAFVRALECNQWQAIPLSALQGDNLTSRSARTPWYGGPTLLGYLQTLPAMIASPTQTAFPVQWINHPGNAPRGYSGTLAQGRISTGDQIRVTASGQTSRVAAIVTMDGPLDHAQAGQAVTVQLAPDITVARGDILSLASEPIETTDQFEATLVWVADDPGLVGRSYDIQLSTQSATASLTAIKYRTNTSTLEREPATHLAPNDVCNCNLALNRPLAFDAYRRSPTLGGFILVDRTTLATVAVGWIRHSLRRAQNVHQQMLSTQRVDRERLNQHKAAVVWFTGLSGSGKSTIANALEVELHAQGKRTYILDGDNVRRGLNKDLGFTDADRVENIRRITEVARLMLDAGLIVIVAFISPFLRERQMARELIGSQDFIEVYVDTPLEVCELRDVKGLYKKARAGQLPNMSGISSPYEPPTAPDITLDGSTGSVQDSVAQVIAALPDNRS